MNRRETREEAALSAEGFVDELTDDYQLAGLD
jgi:hypothetical protein